MALKKQTGIRLSETDEKLLAALSEKKGVNKTSVIVLAVREMAQREGVQLTAPASEEHPADIVRHPADIVRHPADIVRHPADIVRHPSDTASGEA